MVVQDIAVLCDAVVVVQDILRALKHPTILKGDTMGRRLLLRGASVSLASVVVLSCLFNLCIAQTLPSELHGTDKSVIIAMQAHFICIMR